MLYILCIHCLRARLDLEMAQFGKCRGVVKKPDRELPLHYTLSVHIYARNINYVFTPLMLHSSIVEQRGIARTERYSFELV